ncbi:hypothetical protein [Bradyrhizobium sp. CCBAU 53421]|uniref:hypothetical protein n=1 Tax=Bradyrhizobium sp. CCBAU 53421 TaxID=1325120 RepID=UPI00188B4306|nr:hypothetical protein [Bradyrhizobium sp. CCBAU 53421]QOZ32833.1 hypothetical protein XH92_14995 [Bradyrhizobium sp. CCBAU 53421]
MPFEPVYRVHNEATRITNESAFIREIVQRALELLKLPVPDTFLGRKTQEPFPQEECRYGEEEDHRRAS